MRRFFNTALRLQMPGGDALLRWAGKGSGAVLDQGLFSGANFLVNILLARWLAPEEYGAFAVALSIYYFLMGFHTAVLTEPMMVFGAGKYRGQFKKYLGMLLYGHWGLSALIAVLLAVAAFGMQSFGSKPIAQALAGLAIASPFLLLLWLVRRGCYVEMQPQWAVLGSGLNLVVTLAGLFLLWHAGLVSSLSALVLLGAAAAIASLLPMVLHLRPHLGGFAGNPTPAMVLENRSLLKVTSVIQTHWSYGRWLILQTIVYWAFSDAIVPILIAFHGLSLMGVFRAYQNFTVPIFQFLTALNLLILPLAVRKYRGEGISGLRRVALAFTMLCVLSTSLYGVFVYLLRRPLVSFLLGEAYLPYVDLLSVWLLAPVILAFGRGADVAARSRERPQFIFYSYIAGTVAAIWLFFLLIPFWALWGAVWGRVGSFAVQTIILLCSFWYILTPRLERRGDRQCE